MTSFNYYIRLGAALFTAAIFGLLIIAPQAGRDYATQTASVAATATERSPLAEKACAIGEPAFAGPFTKFDDVLSISPLGSVTAPGEILPAPFIRINTRQGETAFVRRTVAALTPVRADIVAIERHIERNPTGRVIDTTWTVRFQPCKDITFYYNRISNIDEKLLARAGGVTSFTELGGPDHLAIEVRLRVAKGEKIGTTRGFDVGLHDKTVAAISLIEPARYTVNPYEHADIFDAPPSLIKAISPDIAQARCPIDYLPTEERLRWSDLLGDAWGLRRAKGANACRTALQDIRGAVQGAWFTDSSHNGSATKFSAIALAADAIDPNRMIFALHGRLASLTPEMIGLAPSRTTARDAATREFLSFEKGEDINKPFDTVTDELINCYEKLRVNFVGPAVNGVILLRRSETPEGGRVLTLEARSDAMRCNDFGAPYTFSGNQTTFFR